MFEYAEPTLLLGAAIFIFWIIFLHIFLDAACLLCCLFPERFPYPYFGLLYVSIFWETVNCENAALARTMVYWAAAMSLVRVLALVFASFELLAVVAAMYVLEGLVAAYEGFYCNTIKHKTARLISFFSFAFALCIIAFLCVLHSPVPSAV